MILTVTPNTAIDWTILVQHFVWNETLRASQNVWGMGGKPADASWVLGELGLPTRAMGFSAGTVGKKMEELLHLKGVKTDFVQVDGETRVDVHIIDEQNHGQSTLVVDTLMIKDTHVKELLKKYEAALEKTDAVITGGSLPKSLNKNILVDLVAMARKRNIPVALDTSGKYLLPALEAHPNVIKPNRMELSTIAGKPVITVEDAYHAALNILKKYGTEVIVTLGAADALAVLKDRSYLIPMPQVDRVVSTAGAGDGVLAGIGHALAEHKPLEEGLKLGFAAAGAVIMTLGTADCRKADVEKILPTIQLIPYK
jgi:1-phosphofructokinase family hexose kinase